MFSILFHTKTKENNFSWQNSAMLLNNVAKTKRDMSISYCGQNLFLLIPNLIKTDWKFTTIEYNRDILMEKNFCRICSYSGSCDKSDRYTINENYNFCFEGICDNIMSFITVFYYMLKAANSPIVSDEKHGHIKRERLNKQRKLIKSKDDWIIKYLYIDSSKIKYEKSNEHIQMEKDGFILKEVKVKGHLRNQAYGTGFSKHRMIYIESFTSTKWMKDGNIKIIVNTV